LRSDCSLRSYRPERRVFEYKLRKNLKDWVLISATMPNRTPPGGREAEYISACHLAEMAINDEKTGLRVQVTVNSKVAFYNLS
jgi:hypothetical protein